MTRCPYCGDPMIGHPTACRPTKFWQALQTVPAPVPDNMTTDPPPVLRRDCPFCRDELALLRAEVADLTRHAEAMARWDCRTCPMGSDCDECPVAAYRRAHPLPQEKP